MQSTGITEDRELLDMMLQDMQSADAEYQPGDYWRKKAVSIAKEIVRSGLREFRGDANSIGLSYTDNAYVDVLTHFNSGIKASFASLLRNVYPINRIHSSQVELTRGYYLAGVRYKNKLANNSSRIKMLLAKYKMPEDTLKGGSIDFSVIQGRKIANHYLSLLDAHDNLASVIDYRSARTHFEIGGGFGVNVHLLVENYPNIRKYVYLDIAPNLYVGTQYLKSFYGDCVKTYADTRRKGKLSFRCDDALEIVCIAPYQIEDLDVEIDVFHNAHSFVEMPEVAVRNYAGHVKRVMRKPSSRIALVSYDCYDLNTTFHPDKLPTFFERKFTKHLKESIWEESVSNIYYIS